MNEIFGLASVLSIQTSSNSDLALAEVILRLISQQYSAIFEEASTRLRDTQRKTRGNV